MESALLWTTAVGSALTAAATIGLVWVAWRTLGGARDQLVLLQLQSAREGRPYVVAEVVPGLHGAGSSDLIVQNLGRTLAHRVVIDVGALSIRDEDDYISGPLSEYLSKPKTLAPGSRHRVMWRCEPREEACRGEAGAPKTARGRVSYTDDAGCQYMETYDLSVDGVMQVTPVPDCWSTVTRGGERAGEHRSRASRPESTRWGAAPLSAAVWRIAIGPSGCTSPISGTPHRPGLSRALGWTVRKQVGVIHRLSTETLRGGTGDSVLPIGLATKRSQKYQAPYRLGRLEPYVILRLVLVSLQTSPHPWIRRSRCFGDAKPVVVAMHTCATAFAASPLSLRISQRGSSGLLKLAARRLSPV